MGTLSEVKLELLDSEPPTLRKTFGFARASLLICLSFMVIICFLCISEFSNRASVSECKTSVTKEQLENERTNFNISIEEYKEISRMSGSIAKLEEERREHSGSNTELENRLNATLQRLDAHKAQLEKEKGTSRFSASQHEERVTSVQKLLASSRSTLKEEREMLIANSKITALPGWKAAFYTHDSNQKIMEEYEGDSLQCENLSERSRDEASYIHNEGDCVKLYALLDCKGKYSIVKSPTLFVDVSDLSFRPSSIGAC